MNSSYALPNFSSDYQEGAHARVFDALVATNMEQSSGYGTASVPVAQPMSRTSSPASSASRSRSQRS